MAKSAVVNVALVTGGARGIGRSVAATLASKGMGVMVADLLDRGVLVDPPLRPRFLESRDALDRLARIQEGAGIMELGGIAA